MNPPRAALLIRLGLGLLAFGALLFFKPLEDAYLLPQRAALALAALALALGTWGLPLPATPILGLGLALFAWRFLCQGLSPDAPADGAWFAGQVPELALFLGAAAALRDASARRYAATALLAAAVLGCAYALAAPLGCDPLAAGAVDLGFGVRAHGTLGNPDFLGGWIAMLLPVALAFLAAARGRSVRLVAAVAGLLSLTLLWTLARASWAAAAAGGAATFWIAAYRPPARAALAWGLGLLLAFAAVSVAGPGASGLGPRLREAGDTRSDAWGSRAFMAGVALDLARAHPWLGVGGGAFEREYLGRQGPLLQAQRSQPFRRTADAHNDWLQAAAETGFVGLAVWAGLFLLAVAAARRQGGPEGAAVGGALVAFGVQGCFHFPWDVVPTAGLAVLALGAAAGFGASKEWRGGWGSSLALACALVACLVFDGTRAAASGLLNSGTSLRSVPSARPLSAALLEASARIDPQDSRAWSRLGSVRMAQARPDLAAAAYRQALLALPTDPSAWTNLGLCLGMLGRLPDSVACLRRAAALDPRSNEAWADEAKAEYLMGHKGRALRLARKGIAQAGGSAQAWFNLGGMLLNAGHPALAAPDFEEALRMNPNDHRAAALLEVCRHAR